MTNIKNRNNSSGGRREDRYNSSSGRRSSNRYHNDYDDYDDYDRDQSFGQDDFFGKELTPIDEHCDTESVYMSRLNAPKATFYSSKYNDDRISHSESNNYVRNREHSTERKLYNTQKMFSSREINHQLEQKTGYDNDSVLISRRKNYDNDSIFANRDDRYNDFYDDDSIYGHIDEGYDSDSIFASRRGEVDNGSYDRRGGKYRKNNQYPVRYSDNYYDDRYQRGNRRDGYYNYDGYNNNDPRLPREVRNIRRKKQTKKTIAIVCSIVGGILLILIIFGLIILGDAKNLKAQAYSLKDQFGEVVECISDNDISGAVAASDEADAQIHEIESSLSGLKWKIASILPIVGNDVKAVGQVVDLVEMTNDDIIKPLLDIAKNYPLESLKVGDGFDVNLINVYLDFLEEITPKIEEIDAGFDGIKFNVLDSDGKMTTYLDKVHGLLDKFVIVSENMPFIRAMLGDGSDRIYALVPQNNAEIRAAGGFPGIVGSITIKDGVLSVGEFEGVTEGGFNRYFDYDEAGIGWEEEEIFCDWICNSYDASFIADFPKCGKIWAMAYRDAHGYEYVDGTISMLPQVIQKILALLGQSITLSDGTVIDGTNATKVLVHDLYYTYMTLENTYNEGNVIVDALLKEAAEEAMHMFVSEFGLSNASEYFSFFMECFADKTIQIWLDDEEDQQAIVDIGASGELNTDENNPVAGVYYSSCDTSKDGWFLDITTYVSEPVVNSDGSRTYECAFAFTNTMDYDTYMNAPSSLVSELGGSMQGHMQFFGPAGGTISDLVVSDGTEFSYTIYKDLQCLYYHYFTIPQGSPITVSCKITTAPGVTTPLTFTTTPTLTAYR